jgi:hypothetical protein
VAVVMRVGAKLDEVAAQRVAEQRRAAHSTMPVRALVRVRPELRAQVEHALTERAVEKSARKIEAPWPAVGKTSAEAMNQAIAAEAQRTGLAADKIGETLTKRLGVHGQSAGAQFATMFMGELGKVAPGVSSALGSLRGVAGAMEAIGGGGWPLPVAFWLMGTAAVEAGKHLYEIGAEFDKVARHRRNPTGKMGNDLTELVPSVDHVAVHTASSLEAVGDIAGRVAQAFHVSGEPLEALTKQIADLNRMTGEKLNVRDLGKVMRAFGMDANQATGALDSLKVASENTGAPVGELLEVAEICWPAGP